jgi:hypothetical protein
MPAPPCSGRGRHRHPPAARHLGPRLLEAGGRLDDAARLEPAPLAVADAVDRSQHLLRDPRGLVEGRLVGHPVEVTVLRDVLVLVLDLELVEQDELDVLEVDVERERAHEASAEG